MADQVDTSTMRHTEIGLIPSDWELVKLGEVTYEASERNRTLTYGRDDVLSVDNERGLVPSGRMLGEDFSRYKLVRKNQLAYNPMRLNVGSIGLWLDDKPGIVSPDYIVFGCMEGRVVAVLSFTLHRIPALEPKTALDSYQLIASKILLFAVLSYMLVLCTRNFMSHKHNVVVNKHRQNALMTFKALADAASDSKLKDIILTHASACIFSPQETGYTKATGMASVTGSKSVIELIQGVAKAGE